MIRITWKSWRSNHQYFESYWICEHFVEANSMIASKKSSNYRRIVRCTRESTDSSISGTNRSMHTHIRMLKQYSMMISFSLSSSILACNPKNIHKITIELFKMWQIQKIDRNRFVSKIFIYYFLRKPRSWNGLDSREEFISFQGRQLIRDDRISFVLNLSFDISERIRFS